MTDELKTSFKIVNAPLKVNALVASKVEYLCLYIEPCNSVQWRVSDEPRQAPQNLGEADRSGIPINVISAQRIFFIAPQGVIVLHNSHNVVEVASDQDAGATRRGGSSGRLERRFHFFRILRVSFSLSCGNYAEPSPLFVMNYQI